MYKKKINKGIYRKFFKRPMDIIISMISILLLSPILIIIALCIKIKLGSPILFKQSRPGLNEKVFTIYKFRTMSEEKDSNGKLYSDSIRLTKLGRFLRSTSMDELPELINIIKGDMSIVGPRPLLIEYLPYYTKIEKERHSVKPGLTGLAQISGRNYLPWGKRLQMDVDYTQNITFLNDLIIIFKTIINVISRKNISVDSDQEEGNLVELRKDE